MSVFKLTVDESLPFRLIPWLNGHIPVKEVAFQSGISETDVTRVLSTFYELMTVAYEPDIATMS